jgi:hypothetical protein
MPETTLIPPLTETEARALITAIRADIAEIGRIEQSARAKLLRLKNTDGWRVLGYASFKDMAQAEFGISWQHAYRLIGAEELQNELLLIAPDDTPIIIPETHARELKQLADAPARLEAFQRAKNLAMSEGGTSVKLRHTQAAVQAVKAAASASKYAVIWQAERSGEIGADTAQRLTHLLDMLKPKAVIAPLMQLIAQHRMFNPDLLPVFGKMFERQMQGDTSKVLETALATGCLGNVPLAKATPTDLRQAQQEAQSEHISESLEQQRLAKIAAGKTPVEEVIVTVFKGDPARTLKALEQALGAHDMKRLRDLMLGE